MCVSLVFFLLHQLLKLCNLLVLPNYEGSSDQHCHGTKEEVHHHHVIINVIVTIGHSSAPQWGAADAEIKVPSGENTELKRTPFQAWSRSVYSHICYAYCQGVLPCLFLPIQSIHMHFFQNHSQFFPVLACRIK